MRQSSYTKSNMRKLLSLLILAATLCATAQNAATVTADIVSVKANPKETGDGGIAMRPDGLYTENAPLSFIIRVAFNQQFPDSQIVNMPAWADQHFDITAKVSEGMPDLKSLPRAQYLALRGQLLLQALTERFQFKSHIEEREGPVYALVLAKGGSKLHITPPNPPAEYITPNGQHVQLGLSVTNNSITGHAIPISDLVNALRHDSHLGRTVIDRTGLTGKYDFVLHWTPDSATPQDNGTLETNYPELFTAIQEQLGFRLEPAKGPVSTLVIDHIEKPSSN